MGWFRLRSELIRLSLFEGFDELLCLPALRGVETHWYQVETVRKVLKQYRGRVLLADEVGLGKTIEAGMVLKEYALRGMAERILILTPASLVGQWRDEMDSKFGIDFATSHDPLLRTDPARFWAQPRVIASIAAARRKEHAELLAGMSYDVVVVDEAHHLRDQSSASYRLVNSLQKRFLLLLSATPVQNSLLELYNLLTLLKPGIFKTQKEFRSVYMVPGKPREPANRERLRDLMRGVMVRNTRALAALRLPRRHASTMRATPDAAEAGCYRDLSALAREVASGAQHRMAVQHLLAAAGSSPAAAAAAVARFVARHPGDHAVGGAARPLPCQCHRREAGGAAAAARAEPGREEDGVRPPSRFHGASGRSAAPAGHRLRPVRRRHDRAAKDAAVDAFRDEVPVLLCSESGGEGRNLQFCNTLINFDIPWNPMAIEQRIGRIDRIGQTREVFVFNLVTAGTIEDEVLRILDEKINMFELVVGEVGAILGEFEDQHDFSTLVLDAWLRTSEAGARHGVRGAGGTAARRQAAIRRRQGAGRGAVRERARCRLRSAACSASPPTCCAAGRAGRAHRAGRPGGAGAAACAAGARRRTSCSGSASARRCPPVRTRVGIESDWLERFGRLLGQHGRCARLVLHSDARAPSDPQRVLEHALVLDNATFRLLDVVPAWTRYVVLDFRYSAVSDEKRDGVLRLGVNLATGALPDAVLEQMRSPLACGRRSGRGAAGRSRTAGGLATRPAAGAGGPRAPPAARCGAGSIRQGPAPSARPRSGAALRVPQRPASRGGAASVAARGGRRGAAARGTAAGGDPARVSCQAG